MQAELKYFYAVALNRAPKDMGQDRKKALKIVEEVAHSSLC